jgi:hypothetical protein
MDLGTVGVVEDVEANGPPQELPHRPTLPPPTISKFDI